MYAKRNGKALKTRMKTRGLGPNSRRHRLGNLDRRTFEAREFEQFRADLVEHVGGAPNVTQRALIERAAWMRLQIVMMDTKLGCGDFTEQDSRVYLAWVNSLGRLLARLGLEPPASAKPADPMENLRRHFASRETEAA